MMPLTTLSLMIRSLLPAAFSLLGLVTLGCEEVGGSSGGPGLSQVQSLAELIEISGYDDATKALFRTYDNDPNQFANRPDAHGSESLMSWAGPSPFVGTYDTYDVVDYPLSNGRKLYPRTFPGDRKFRVDDIDPTSGDR